MHDLPPPNPTVTQRLSANDADSATTASKASDAAAPSTSDSSVAPERPTEEPSSIPADAPPAKTPAAPATTHTAPAGDNGANSSDWTPRHGANTTRTTKIPSRTSRDYESARGSGRTSAAMADAAEASGRPTRTGTHRRDSGAAGVSTAEPKADSHNDGGGHHGRTARTSERPAAGNGHVGGAS